MIVLMQLLEAYLRCTGIGTMRQSNDAQLLTEC